MKIIKIKNGEVRLGYQLDDLTPEVRAKVIEKHKDFLDNNPVNYEDNDEMVTATFSHSEEEVIESITINEYLFDSDGKILPITFHTRENQIVRITFGKNNLDCTISDPMSEKNVERVLTISTRHISKETRDTLEAYVDMPFRYESHTYGFILFVSALDCEEAIEKIRDRDAEEIIEIMKLANILNCSLVNIDADAEDCNGLKTFDWDVTDPITWNYVVDLNERGEYAAHIEPDLASGAILWEVDTEGMRQLVEDGFMKHNKDMEGLKQHLIDIELLKDTDKLIYKG